MKDTFYVDAGVPDFVHVPMPPRNCISGSVFRRSGEPPAELCDGGDWVQQVQVRVDDPKTGRVYISVRPMERCEWWTVTLEWSEFHDLMLAAVKAHPKACRVGGK